MDVAELERNIANVKNKIRLSCQAVSKSANDVTLVVATKTIEKSVVDVLPKFGITDVGENHATEFRDKYDESVSLKRHFIGALQTNKVKYLVGKCDLIQSVDRQKLVDEIERLSLIRNVVTNVLIEVNVGREVNKSGVLPENLLQLLEYVAKQKSILLKGIMTVLPIDAHEKLYDETYEIFQKVKAEYKTATILSMGMSADFEKAILHGSNMVRVGTSIFGARNYGGNK